jgi:hypothetical protein
VEDDGRVPDLPDEARAIWTNVAGHGGEDELKLRTDWKGVRER